MTDKTDALVARLRMHARDCVSAADMDTDTVLSAAQIDDMADALNKAAEALAAPAGAKGDAESDAEREFFAQDFYEEARAGKVPWPGNSTPQPAEGDGAVAWYVCADTEHWVTDDRDEADKNRSDGCHVRPLIFGDMTRPAATAVVPEGWRVLNFTGSFKARDERWEVYDPQGNGGAVYESDVDPVVRTLLDALAAAPAAPKGGVVERALAELVGAASLMLSEIDTCGHAVDPAYRAALHDAWTQGKAALATGEQP